MHTHEQRTEARAPIDILLNKFVSGVPYLCRASNISQGGMLLHKLLEPEQQVLPPVIGLQFELPGYDRVLTAAATVVYEHPYMRAVGVRFTSLADDHRRLIQRYLLESAYRKSA